MQSENKADAGGKDNSMNKLELLQNFILCPPMNYYFNYFKICSPYKFSGAFSGTLQIAV